jgi:hypothetical protein
VELDEALEFVVENFLFQNIYRLKGSIDYKILILKDRF